MSGVFGAMIAPWLRYWHFAAIGLLAMLLGIQTHRIALLKTERASAVAAAAAARAQALGHVVSVERASARISAEKEQTHEQAIADLRAAAARRLQALVGRPAAVPSVPEAAFQPDASAGGDRLCIETSNAVSLMLSADENTRQLMDLQDWIREQGEVVR